VPSRLRHQPRPARWLCRARQRAQGCLAPCLCLQQRPSRPPRRSGQDADAKLASERQRPVMPSTRRLRPPLPRICLDTTLSSRHIYLVFYLPLLSRSKCPTTHISLYNIPDSSEPRKVLLQQCIMSLKQPINIIISRSRFHLQNAAPNAQSSPRSSSSSSSSMVSSSVSKSSSSSGSGVPVP